jgi:hypothetical protein
LASPYRHIDDLVDEASNRELVSQFTPDRKARLKNESRVTEIRNRIAILTARLAELRRYHPEKQARSTKFTLVLDRPH